MEGLMMVLTMILVVLPSISISLQAFPQERYSNLRIDCGASSQKPTRNPHGLNVSWLTDENFACTGENQLLRYSQNFSTMNSIRYFPDGQKNCYFLPLYLSPSPSNTKFLFRAGFYYGNYDGLSKPPSFNLEMEGNFWATVTTNSTSNNKPVFHEMIYMIKRDGVQACLFNVGHGIPFISSLEATTIDSYWLMENKRALLLYSRMNYGANRSKEMPEYLNIVYDRIVDDTMMDENYPPWPVMQTAIQAKIVLDSIYLSVNFSTQTIAVAHFVLYFKEPINRYPENSIAQAQKRDCGVIVLWA
ncbi:probable LRR receptor-like serine/threonine-protein kinase At1g51860 [Hevea brasiliensis]|uniref:probable LRR receptor-like serine/threonine-protein kinase At1g51860 n=1 Tax=Hevea brasiliensis TaxID=3981 RepID=UPI0025DDE591|nr:probable LRR receptor-like serine/threonine-protein kinase At1g51860 [Hevea brasiliensis]